MRFFECTLSEQILELFTTVTATIEVELPPLFHETFVVRHFFRFCGDFLVSLSILTVSVRVSGDSHADYSHRQLLARATDTFHAASHSPTTQYFR
jgi:hypothetical protein